MEEKKSLWTRGTEKVKEFYENHKKGIKRGLIATGVVGGAALLYKLLHNDENSDDDILYLDESQYDDPELTEVADQIDSTTETTEE